MAVYGKIDEIKGQVAGKAIQTALQYLQSLDRTFLFDKPVGYADKTAINGKNMFALHQVYRTKPVTEARFEAHRKYIDLQYVWEGEELIGITALFGLETIVAYDEEKDIEFYRYFPSTMLIMRPGALAVLYPSDAHAPGLGSRTIETVRKTVMKVRVR